MTIHSWIRKLFSARKPRTIRKARGRGQPLSFEILEDRIVPAIAFEDFSGYPVGSILDRDGGSGWAAPWQVGAGGSSASATRGELGSVSRITATSPFAAFQPGPNRSLESARPLSTTFSDQTAVYLMAMVRVDLTTGFGGSSGGIGLFQGDTQRFLVGQPLDSGNWGVVKPDRSVAPSTIPIVNKVPTLLVAKIDQVHNTFTLWVNPNLLETEAANAPAFPTTTYTGDDSFDTVRLRGSSTISTIMRKWEFDNLALISEGSFFNQPGGQTDWIGQGPTQTLGGQIEGMDLQGNPVSAAIQAIAISPIDPNVVYIGAVNGGVWRTDNINATRTIEGIDPDPAREAPSAAGVRVTAGRFITTNPALTANAVYSYKITQKAANGVESNISDPFPLTGIRLGKEADGTDQNEITLSNLPLAPTGSNTLIYRTKAGGNSYHLVGALNGTLTTYADTKPDSQLVAARAGEQQIPFPIWTPLTDQFSTLAISSLAWDTTPPTIDGTLDGQYGEPLAIQRVNTTGGNNDAADVKRSNGSELDAAYAVIRDGTLYVMLTGNLSSAGSNLDLFIDSKPLGQNVLQGLPAATNNLDRLDNSKFDHGFEADYL